MILDESISDLNKRMRHTGWWFLSFLNSCFAVSEATSNPLIDADTATHTDAVCVASPPRPAHRRLTVVTADDAEVIQVLFRRIKPARRMKKMTHLFNPDYGLKHYLPLISCFSCLLVCETG